MHVSNVIAGVLSQVLILERRMIPRALSRKESIVRFMFWLSMSDHGSPSSWDVWISACYVRSFIVLPSERKFLPPWKLYGDPRVCRTICFNDVHTRCMGIATSDIWLEKRTVAQTQTLKKSHIASRNSVLMQYRFSEARLSSSNQEVRDHLFAG